MMKRYIFTPKLDADGKQEIRKANHGEYCLDSNQVIYWRILKPTNGKYPILACTVEEIPDPPKCNCRHEHQPWCPLYASPKKVEVPKVEHSPTPWKVYECHSPSAFPYGIGSDTETDFAARCRTKPNADFIVRAVNSHDALMELVEDLATCYPKDEGIRKILAIAKGEA
jgi:hypothetical protein